MTKLNEKGSRTSRSILMGLLAGTMLTIPLAGDADAKATLLPVKSTTSGQTGFSTVVERARPAVVSIMVKKSTSAGSTDQFNFGQGLPDSKSFKEFLDRFGLPRDFAERFNMPKGKMKPQLPSRGQGSVFLSRLTVTSSPISTSSPTPMRSRSARMLAKR